MQTSYAGGDSVHQRSSLVQQRAALARLAHRLNVQCLGKLDLLQAVTVVAGGEHAMQLDDGLDDLRSVAQTALPRHRQCQHGRGAGHISVVLVAAVRILLPAPERCPEGSLSRRIVAQQILRLPLFIDRVEGSLLLEESLKTSVWHAIAHRPCRILACSAR
jgi:hypothetical protein